MIKNTKTLISFILNSYIGKVDIACDMTLGNGHDSMMILELCHPKKLYAFDIQEAAFIKSKELLGDRSQVKFIHDGHENFDLYLKDNIDLAIFNLGYMPGQDKTIKTDYKKVITCLEKLLMSLNKNGHIIITLYPGHDSGKQEAEKIYDFLIKLNQKEFIATKFDFINQVNFPPHVIMIEKVY